jgi:hypothetical protein
LTEIPMYIVCELLLTWDTAAKTKLHCCQQDRLLAPLLLCLKCSSLRWCSHNVHLEVDVFFVNSQQWQLESLPTTDYQWGFHQGVVFGWFCLILPQIGSAMLLVKTKMTRDVQPTNLVAMRDICLDFGFTW